MEIRLATTAERLEYSERVYPLQDLVLDAVARSEADLVLTGGTALSRIYFSHRLSEDLDFFTTAEDVRPYARDLSARLSVRGVLVEPERTMPGFVRLYAVRDDVRLKLEIIFDPHRVEAPERSESGYLVDTLRDIGANKIGAFEDRGEVKDVIDLYYLSRALGWDRLFEDAEAKRVPIAYEDLQHVLDTPLRGAALLLEPIAPDAIERFAKEVRDRVALEIKKKVALWQTRIPDLVADLLWDTPRELRTLTDANREVVLRRARGLSLPKRLALETIAKQG